MAGSAVARGRAIGWAGRIMALLAVALGAAELARPGLLFGATPDSSVYLAAGARLIQGELPYRDLLMLQPPGIVVIAAPFGALTSLIGSRDALALFRCCMPILAGLNVLMVARLLSHRGVLAVVLGTAVMALFPAELYSASADLMEPWVNAATLLALCLVFDGEALTGSRRRQAGAGAMLALAAGIKLLGVVAGLVLVVVVVVALRRALPPLVAGGAAALLALVGPFVAADPGGFWRDVVGAQLGRIPAGARSSLWERLLEVVGLAGSPIAVQVALVAAAGVTASGVAVLRLTQRHRAGPLARFAVWGTVAVLLSQFLPSQWYPQYVAVVAPPLALLAGLAVSLVQRQVPRRWPIAAVAVLVGAGVVVDAAYVHGLAAPDPAAVVDARIPAGSCTLAIQPEYLVTANRYLDQAAACHQLADPFGLDLADTPAAAAARWKRALSAASYIVAREPPTQWGMPSPTLVAYVRRHFTVGVSDGLDFYRRDSAASSP